jgi:hypothetical protein
MSIAAGNEYSMGEYSYNWYTSTTGAASTLASYADYGVVGTPSTYIGNTSIAAVENVAYPQASITVAGTAYGYSDVSDDVCSTALLGNDYAYVMVPNYGEADDYADIDVTGKVAVVSRGSITFSEKVVNAAAAGAVALIVYNNTTGTINMSIDDYQIPAVSVLQTTGAAMEAALEADPNATVHFDEELTNFENENAWLMCEFSSWGTTSDLAFKPALSSVGGNVYSASMNGDDAYELMSGTSMATPNASGNFAQLSQYVEENFTTDGESKTCYAENFTDVDLSRWYHEAIDYAVDTGLMKGMSETTFEPNTALTRGQLVTILYRNAGEPSVEGLENPFTDVPSGKFYTDAVIWAYSEGVVKGITATTYQPNAAVTREQLVTILYRYDGEQAVGEDVLADYTDKDNVSNYAKDAVNWAVSKGMITSTSTSALVLSPKDSATRAQVAKIIMGYLGGSYDCTATDAVTLTKVERAQIVEDLAESTATILMDNDYALYSPRKQGAGLMNVADAVASDAYIKSPLIELGDDKEKTGEYTMEFDVVNLSDETKSYEIDPWVLVDYAVDYSDTAYSIFDTYSVYNTLTSDYAGFDFTTNCEDDVLTLEPGETKTVSVTVTLDDETKAYMDETFINGGFVDGYVILWEQVDGELTYNYIHASFLGFYGDWEQASILTEYDFADVIDAYDFLYNYDLGNWNENYAGYVLAQFGYTVYDLLEMDIGFNEAYLTDGYSIYDYVGGSQLFYNEQNDAYNAISNGGADGYYDADVLYMFPTQLRNARHLIMTVTNAETGELYYAEDSEYLRKAVYESSYAAYLQVGEFYWDGINYMDEAQPYVENNTLVTISYYADLDYGEDVLGEIEYEDLLADGTDYLEWTFNVMVDTETPEISDAEYDEETGALTITASDNYYMATVSVYDEDFNLVDAVLADAEPGESAEYVLDLSETDSSIVYVLVSDYATNYYFGYMVLDESAYDDDATGEFEWVYIEDASEDLSGEYVITGTNYSTYDMYILDASGDVTGTDIGKAAGAIDWNNTDVDYADDYGYYLTGVTDDLIYVVEQLDNGNYTIRMKGSDNYLAYPGSGNSLTTTTDTSDAYAQWTIVSNEDDDGYGYTNIYNVGSSDRALLFNTSSSLFRCYAKTFNGTDYASYNIDLYRKVADDDEEEEPVDPDPTETDPTEPTEPTEPTGTYTEVTDASALKADGKYIITATLDGVTYYVTDDAATVTNALNAVELADMADATVWTLGAGAEEGNYTLSTSNGSIAYGGSGTTLTVGEEAAELTFDYVADTGMTVKFAVSTNRYLTLRVNNGVPQFRAYADNNLANTEGGYYGYLTVYEVN